MVTQMVVALQQLNRDVDVRGHDTACEHGVPTVGDDEALALLDRLDDLRDTVAEQHLNSFVEGLDDDTSARFLQWLQRRKLDIIHIKLNHKELARITDHSDIDTKIAVLRMSLQRAKQKGVLSHS